MEGARLWSAVSNACGFVCLIWQFRSGLGMNHGIDSRLYFLRAIYVAILSS